LLEDGMIPGAHLRILSAGALAFLLALPGSAQDARTKIKPGINSFTPQQDIELGHKMAAEIEQTKQMCNNPEVDGYLTKLGKRLVERLNTGGVAYPWEFHCINDQSLNAFALPGGFVFVNRGSIEAADNEAELAGVLAHEMSHVALRHGTNQLTKAQYAQLGTGMLGAAGGVFGGAAGAAAAGVGQFATGGVLLKYTRTAEVQADVMGTQVLYDAGYDPRALAAFFEKLGAETQGKSPMDFFSDHPNPDHRIDRIDQEVHRLGGVPEGAKRDSPEFAAVKKEVAVLPAPVKKQPATTNLSAKKGTLPAPGTVRVGIPSATMSTQQLGRASLQYPGNWKKFGNANNMILAPDGGIVDSGNGQPAIAYGVSAGVTRIDGQLPAETETLEAATEKLIESLRQQNEAMVILRDSREVTLNGERGLSTYLKNDSPGGGPETDWLVTVIRPEGLVYFVCVAPQPEFGRFQGTFESILNSVHFSR
jgi:beta-barrel assembly-enhancing protease